MFYRVTRHPILEFPVRKMVTIIVNGEKINCYEGEPIAAALLASGIKVFRRSPRLHEPRGVFCAIGRCNDCIMKVDGVPGIRTCVTPVREGMIIESQDI